MIERSENDWPVLIPAQLTWFTAAGERFAAANEHIAVLAGYLITRWNDEVESIAGRVLDDWSFASRNIRGSLTEISNHASATAWDLNATEHPRGVHGTFSPKKTLAVRRILADIERITGIPVFRWGNDYRPPTPIDSMHVEVNVGEHSVAIAAEKLTAHLTAQQGDDDMKWSDKIALTDTDARIWGTDAATGKPYVAGQEVTFGLMVRYPTLARKLEHEMTAQFAEQGALIAQLKKSVDTLTAALAKKP